MGTAVLRKIQYGKESVHGTAVAATKLLPASVPPIAADRKPTYPRENVGVLADASRAYISGRLVRDKLSWDSSYFQLLPLLFSCGVRGGLTPTETTPGQGDYAWVFTPNMDGTSNEQDSITLERGGNDFMVKTEYVMFDSIKISGEVNQEGGDSTQKIEVSYFGRQNTAASFTAGLSIPTLTPINAKLTRLFIDSAWADVGTTEKTLTLRAYDIEIATGLHPKFHGSGNEYFDNHGEGPMGIVAAFTFEGNANSAAIYAAHLAQSLQVVRLKTVGPQIGAGTSFLQQLDFSGTWEEVIPLASESNGNDLWTAVLHGIYDPTGGKLLDVAVVTDHNTL